MTIEISEHTIDSLMQGAIDLHCHKQDRTPLTRRRYDGSGHRMFRSLFE